MKKKFFFLVLILFLLNSCSTRSIVYPNSNDDSYTFIQENKFHNIKFHSLGGRKDLPKFLPTKNWIFTNRNYMSKNKIDASLYSIKNFPPEIHNIKPTSIKLFNKTIVGYELEINKKIKRFFKIENTKYVYEIDFKRISSDFSYIKKFYIDEQMNGLEF